MTELQRNSTVLLVEDHRDIAEMILEFLEQRGFAVDYAGDGLTGLHLAVTNPYDVIVLDLMLPGLDGVALCRKLRPEARNETPLLCYHTPYREATGIRPLPLFTVLR